MANDRERELIPARGAISERLMLEVARELNSGDIGRIGDGPKMGVAVLQKPRAVHHRQALLLAEGRTVKEVAAIVGCTPQRLTQLQADPTFCDLLSYYQDQQMATLLADSQRIGAKLVDVAEQAVDEIALRLEDDAKRAAIGVGELRQIAQLGLDRTVAPPKTAVTTPTMPTAITISFGTPIRTDAALASKGEYIEAVAESPAGPGETREETREETPALALKVEMKTVPMMTEDDF